MTSVPHLIGSLCHRAGYELIPSWRLAHWQQSQLFRMIFDRYRIDCVLDVGANKGQFVDYLRSHVGYQGEIVSFEPIAANGQFLSSQAVSDPHWKICPYALGRTNEWIEINVMSNDVFSSFLKPDVENLPEFAAMNSVRNTESVQVRRLDDALDELRIDPSVRSIFLKLDTQGFDLEVIAGGPKSRELFKGIQSEVSSIPIYKGMPDMQRSIQEIKQLGFELAGLFSVSQRADLSAIEFDAIFVNCKLA